VLYKLALIALGGGAGSLLRYGLAGVVQGPRLTGAAVFPFGTLAVNALGCLAIGVCAALFLSGRYIIAEEYRIALMIGVLGGFTTFSTFGYETFELANDGQWFRAGLNVLATNAVCLIAVWIGYRLIERMVGA
jgi:CrcB protein